MSIAVHCDVQDCQKFSADPNSAGFIEVRFPDQTFHFCGLPHAAGALGTLAAQQEQASAEAVADSEV